MDCELPRSVHTYSPIVCNTMLPPCRSGCPAPVSSRDRKSIMHFSRKDTTRTGSGGKLHRIRRCSERHTRTNMLCLVENTVQTSMGLLIPSRPTAHPTLLGLLVQWQPDAPVAARPPHVGDEDSALEDKTNADSNACAAVPM